jgi:hypothetical protein
LVAYKPVPHDSHGFEHTNYYTGILACWLDLCIVFGFTAPVVSLSESCSFVPYLILQRRSDLRHICHVTHIHRFACLGLDFSLPAEPSWEDDTLCFCSSAAWQLRSARFARSLDHVRVIFAVVSNF